MQGELRQEMTNKRLKKIQSHAVQPTQREVRGPSSRFVRMIALYYNGGASWEEVAEEALRGAAA